MVRIFDRCSMAKSPIDTLAESFDGKVRWWEKKNREAKSAVSATHSYVTSNINRALASTVDPEADRSRDRTSSVIRLDRCSRRSSQNTTAFSFSLSFSLFSTRVSFYMFLGSYRSLISRQMRQTIKRYAILSVPTRTFSFLFFCHAILRGRIANFESVQI